MSSAETSERASAMRRTITLITKNDPITPVEGDVGLLVECPPDASLLGAFRGNRVIGIEELIGGYDETKHRAYDLTCKLLEGEPAIEGILQLLVIRESLIQVLEDIFNGLNLANWLKQANMEKVIFRAPSPYWHTVRNLRAYVGSSYEIVGPAQESVSSLEKLRENVRNAGAKGALEALGIFARQLYPCHARYFAAMPSARRARTQGGWWFYSTAYTFTNIGLAYEPHLPEPLNYLCESSGSSFGPLRERGRQGFDIYAWGELGDLPSHAEMNAVANTLKEHISGVRLDGDDDLARRALLESEMFRKYLQRRLPLLVFHGRLLKRWLDQVRPELIVVGNPGMEGALLQLAQQKGIPSVVLQHGILGDYYQVSDQAGDVLLVRGRFWRDFVTGSMRDRTVVLNIPGAKSGATTRSKGTKVLFLSYVDDSVVHAHSSDLRDILAVCLRVAAEARRTLVVRAHPMEQVGFLRRIADEICARDRLVVDVEYSQGPGLEEVVQQAAVAVTFSSTVFLDCLRLGVPIISYDWHQFSYKALIAKEKTFYFARSLQELGELIQRGLEAKLDISNSYSHFVAPTPPAEIKVFFAQQAGKVHSAVSRD